MSMAETDFLCYFSEANVFTLGGSSEIWIMNDSWFSQSLAINCQIDLHPAYQASKDSNYKLNRIPTLPVKPKISQAKRFWCERCSLNMRFSASPRFLTRMYSPARFGIHLREKKRSNNRIGSTYVGDSSRGNLPTHPLPTPRHETAKKESDGKRKHE